MAKVHIDDYEFEIPDGKPVTGSDIKEMASEHLKEPVEGSPYVRRENTDHAIGDKETYVPRRGDQIGFIRTFETA